jgi:hypothetical protein
MIEETFHVPPQDKVFVVPAKSHTFVVPPQDKVFRAPSRS